MPSITEALAERIDSNDINAISQQLGVNSETAEKAVGVAIPGMIAALSRVASDPQKSEQLAQVVNQHSEHTGNLFDQMGDLFKKFTQSEDSSTGGADLGKLIPDLLGPHGQRVEKGVAKTSGLNSEMTGKLIKFLGPIVVGAIAKQLSGKHVDASTVNSRLNEEQQQLQEKHGDLMGRLFDQDDDGDFDMSDMANLFLKRMKG